jgi:hypothetical protein
LPALKYTTSNASGATLTAGSFPPSVSGAWSNNVYTISGTPTATGTFTYTVTTTNLNGCSNASKAGTITVGLDCSNCASWTTCTGFTLVSNVSSENHTIMTWSTANSYCIDKGTGWRLPSLTELECMCSNKSSLPGGYDIDCNYWASTPNGPYYYVVGFFSSGCKTDWAAPSSMPNVKCVK